MSFLPLPWRFPLSPLLTLLSPLPRFSLLPVAWAYCALERAWREALLPVRSIGHSDLLHHTSRMILKLQLLLPRQL